MLRGQILPFIVEYVEMVSSSLSEMDSSYRLTKTQKLWLGFCISGILLTNTVCWTKFSQAGFGSWLENSLSWMFRHSKINWEKLFQYSIRSILRKYNLTEGSLEIDDTERERSKNSKGIHHLGKQKDKKSGGYFMGQSIIFVLLVTKKISIPVGFEFYKMDSELKAWQQQDAKLIKKGIKKKNRPVEPQRNPMYPTKNAIRLYSQKKCIIARENKNINKMDYYRERNRPESFQSLTSVTVEEFDMILPFFSQEIKWEFRLNSRGKPRMNGLIFPTVLPDPETYLFFILSYLKNNPLQEYHGASFGIAQETVSRLLNKGLLALNRSLKKMGFSPCRNGEDLEDFAKQYRVQHADNEEDLEDDSPHFFIDGSDTHINRPKEEKEQEDNYSGKHKLHGIKNTFVSDENATILYVGQTENGSVHDKKMADEEMIKFPDFSYLFMDLGYVGFLPSNTINFIPNKKPKGGALTLDQKIENQMIASVRVVVEHAIGGVKRCRILLDKIRLYSMEKRDRVIETCAALHNFRIKCRPKRKLHPIYRTAGM